MSTKITNAARYDAAMDRRPSIAEYRDAMVRIGRLATALRKRAADGCAVVGGLTPGAMNDALELERSVRALLQKYGITE